MINFVSRLERDENEDKLADRLQKCIGLKNVLLSDLLHFIFDVKKLFEKVSSYKIGISKQNRKRHLTIFWMP